MNFLDLFLGIGGFALGAYWAGMRFDNHYYSEVDDYAIKVYGKRFPDSIGLGDIKQIRGADLPKGEWIIAGGFPCQDISVAGKGAGLAGERSGLWYEYARIIGELRPRYAIMENVGALSFRGLDAVLASLAEIGYNAEWQDIRASDVGAPHKRERIWIIAYPVQNGCKYTVPELGLSENTETWKRKFDGGHAIEIWAKAYGAINREHDGIPGKLDRYRYAVLGNSIVPQIAEMIFRGIKQDMEGGNTKHPYSTLP
jgi:DNA (cytosine-5)-methyltransferase 1